MSSENRSHFSASALVRKLDEISRYYAFLLAKTADTKGWAKDE
ncbi:hypothetical protein FHS26_005429 [Rhizobium pisi]|uniref:Uncharacterized protein n=1 Tax=Rhizobium pisi TaxID=574561 RepID=A0A7W5BRT2_9HYPH|nr:hypothetical protein [Rhizobium pisi]